MKILAICLAVLLGMIFLEEYQSMNVSAKFTEISDYYGVDKVDASGALTLFTIALPGKPQSEPPHYLHGVVDKFGDVSEGDVVQVKTHSQFVAEGENIVFRSSLWIAEKVRFITIERDSSGFTPFVEGTYGAPYQLLDSLLSFSDNKAPLLKSYTLDAFNPYACSAVVVRMQADGYVYDLVRYKTIDDRSGFSEAIFRNPVYKSNPLTCDDVVHHEDKAVIACVHADKK